MKLFEGERRCGRRLGGLGTKVMTAVAGVVVVVNVATVVVMLVVYVEVAVTSCASSPEHTPNARTTIKTGSHLCIARSHDDCSRAYMRHTNRIGRGDYEIQSSQAAMRQRSRPQ